MEELKIAPEFYSQRIASIAKRSYKLPKKIDKSIIRSNCTCDLCNGAGGKFLVCIYCNVVCHYTCYLLAYKVPNKNEISESNWICFHCEESIEYDKTYHRKTVMKKATEEFAFYSQIKIAACWRRYSTRQKFKKIYSIIIQLQISFHVRMQKRKFMLLAQKRLRTIKLKIHGLSNLFVYFRENHDASNPSTPTRKKQSMKKEVSIFFIISVQDYGNSDEYEFPMLNQTWRIDSSLYLFRSSPNLAMDIPIDEKFILGGVDGFQGITISLFQKNLINNGRDIFLGQTTVDLSHNNLWKNGGYFDDIPLEDYQIDIIDPLNHRSMKIETGFFETLKGSYNDFTRKCEKTNGKISFDVITSSSMSTECCQVYCPALDDFIRELRKSPDQTGFTIPAGRNNRIQKKAIPSTKRKLANEEFNESSTSLPPISPNTLNLSPESNKSLGSVTTTNNNRSATPSTPYVHFSEHQHSIALKKVWMCIVDGKMYFYGHFGDPLKLVLDLHYFQVAFDFYFEHDPKANSGTKNKKFTSLPQLVSNETTKGGNVIYCLYRRTGSPDFKLYPAGEKNIFTLKCALLTSLRASKGSIPIPGLPNWFLNPFTPNINRFDVNVLSKDLLALEDIKSKQLSEPPKHHSGPMKYCGLRLVSTNFTAKAFSFDIDEEEEEENDDYEDELDRENHGRKIFVKKSTLSSSSVYEKNKRGKSIHLPPIVASSSSSSQRNDSSSSSLMSLSSSYDSVKTPNLLSRSSSLIADGLYAPGCSSCSFSRDFDHQKSLRFELLEEYQDDLTYSTEDFSVSRSSSRSINRSRSNSNQKYSPPKMQTEEVIQQQLNDQMTIDTMIQNEKYQNLGERFVKSVLSKAADRQIHSNYYRPRLSYSDPIDFD